MSPPSIFSKRASCTVGAAEKFRRNFCDGNMCREAALRFARSKVLRQKEHLHRQAFALAIWNLVADRSRMDEQSSALVEGVPQLVGAESSDFFRLVGAQTGPQLCSGRLNGPNGHIMVSSKTPQQAMRVLLPASEGEYVSNDAMKKLLTGSSSSEESSAEFLNGDSLVLLVTSDETVPEVLYQSENEATGWTYPNSSYPISSFSNISLPSQSASWSGIPPILEAPRPRSYLAEKAVPPWANHVMDQGDYETIKYRGESSGGGGQRPPLPLPAGAENIRTENESLIPPTLPPRPAHIHFVNEQPRMATYESHRSDMLKGKLCGRCEDRLSRNSDSALPGRTLSRGGSDSGGGESQRTCSRSEESEHLWSRVGFQNGPAAEEAPRWKLFVDCFCDSFFCKCGLQVRQNQNWKAPSFTFSNNKRP